MTFSDTLHRRAETTPPTPYDPLPIDPDEVRAGITRELKDLAGFDLSEPEKLTRAVEVTASKIRNSSVFVVTQADNSRCHTCGEPLDGTQPEVAILQAKPGKPLWLHSGECHSEHSRRRAALVETIMATAGYGVGQREGEAA